MWNSNVTYFSLTSKGRRIYNTLKTNQTEKIGKLCDDKRTCRKYLNCGLHFGNQLSTKSNSYWLNRIRLTLFINFIFFLGIRVSEGNNSWHWYYL